MLQQIPTEENNSDEVITLTKIMLQQIPTEENNSDEVITLQQQVFRLQQRNRESNWRHVASYSSRLRQVLENCIAHDRAVTRSYQERVAKLTRTTSALRAEVERLTKEIREIEQQLRQEVL